MIGNGFALARAGSLAALLVMLAPLQVAAEEPATVDDGAVHYETSDPVDSPPVNFRSDYDDAYDTQDNHDAEMYAEEYERRQREEKIRNREQLDKINDFTSGATTSKGITGGSGY
ncbi:MAG: hypothetical protein RIC04_05340 [Parvibaculum sp.]|uniref:hypothetical protein n=1 Tax=Parvibaculum sp. TaxID=2024848 RepID=UPI0032EE916A